MSSEQEDLIHKTDELATAGDWGSSAEEANRRLIELDPKRVIAYTRLAKCLRDMGNPEAAEALYGRVVELDPGNRIARNFLADLKVQREAVSKTDVDRLATDRARARGGVPRLVSETEFTLLVQACRAVPPARGEYEQKDYITNVLLTVLDLQMHNVTVNNSITFYWNNRWDEIRTLEQLADVLERFASNRDGNREASRYLWGNNYWNRIEWLRGLVEFLIANDLRDYESLREWAHNSEYRRDFEGRVRYLGIAAYKWLTMRLGVDTIKPDVHLHNFVEPLVGHPVTDAELVRVLERVAREIGIGPRALDASIWEYQRGGPGTI